MPGSTWNRVNCICGKLVLLIFLIQSAFSFANQKPQANDDHNTVFQGRWALMDVLANDGDPDGQLLQVRILPGTVPSGAQALVESDGAVHFQSPPGFVGDLSFEYEICDTPGTCGPAQTDRATVTVTVLPDGSHARVFSQEFDHRQQIQRQDLFANMPDTAVSRRVSKSFVIRNDGPLPMTFTGAIVANGASGAFFLHEPSAPGAGEVVAPYGEVRFRLFFQPTSLGTHTASITLPLDDPRGDFQFSVQGEALPPQHLPNIRVELNGTLVQNGDSFDSRGGPHYQFDIINTGSQTLQLGDLHPPSQYTISQWLPEQLQPGAAGQFVITLQGATYPPIAGALRFATNVPDLEDFVISENHWPVAHDDYRQLEVDEVVFLNLPANDTDPDEDIPRLAPSPDVFPGLSYDGTRFTTSQGGLLYRIDDRLAQYLPPPGFQGQEQFLYRIEDGRGRSTLGQVVLDIGEGSAQPTTLELIAQDGFANGDVPLHNAPVSYHREAGVHWQADPPLKINGSGFVTTEDLTGETHLKGTIPFLPWLYPGSVFEIQADLRLKGSKWIALAFTHGSGGVFGNQADLVFLLRPDGSGALFASHLYPLAYCDPPSNGYAVDPESFNTVKLRFDREDQSVSVWVNGVRALHRVAYQDPETSIPIEESITRAGFYAVTDPAGTPEGDLGLDGFAVRKGQVHQPELRMTHGGSLLPSGSVLPLHLQMGEHGQLSVQMQNTGNQDLAISNFSLDGGPQWSLAAPANPNVSLAPGETVEWRFALQGTQFGSHPAAVVFNTNDPDQPHWSLTLDGHVDVSANPMITCRRDSSEGPLVISGEILQYPDSHQGRLGVLARLYIDNVSGQTLQLDVVSDSPNQWEQVYFSGSNLPPGARARLEYRVLTQSLGLKTTNLTVTLDQPSLHLEFSLQSQVVPDPGTPEIEFQTVDQLVWPGEDVVFEVVAAGGTPPYTYEWHIDGGCCSLVTCSLIQCDLPHVSGAHTAQVLISGVSAADVGGYNVVVTDSANRVVSSHRSFLHLKEPRFELEAIDQSGDGSGPVTFDVRVDINPAFTPTYTWRKDGTPLSGSDTRYQGVATKTLALLSPGADQEGVYDCLVDDGNQVIASTASFHFLENDRQLIDAFRNGLPPKRGLPIVIQTTRLDGKEAQSNNGFWSATEGLRYTQGVTLEGTLAGFASIPFKTGGSDFFELDLELASTQAGDTLAVGVLHGAALPWPVGQPLVMKLSFLPGDQVDVTISAGGGFSQSFTIAQQAHLLDRLRLRYDPDQDNLSFELGQYHGAVALPAPLTGSHLGFSIEIDGPDMSPPNIQRFHASREELPRARDDVFDVVFGRLREVVLDPLVNDEGTDLQILSFEEPNYGTVQPHVSGGLMYVPSIDFVGTDEFTYTVVNHVGRQARATVTLLCRFDSDQTLHLTEGLFQTHDGQSLALDMAPLLWSDPTGAAHLLSAGYPLAAEEGIADVLGPQSLIFSSAPAGLRRERFSVEVQGPHDVRLGEVAVVVRDRVGEHVWETFQREPSQLGQAISGSVTASQNSIWSLGYFPKQHNDLVFPLTFGPDHADFGLSEDMLALVPYTPDPNWDAVISVQADLSDPQTGDRLVLGFAEQGFSFFPQNRNTQALWISLDRSAMNLVIRESGQTQTAAIAFDQGLLDRPVDLRLHLQADRGLAVYLDSILVYEREDAFLDPLFSSRLRWAGFGLDAVNGGEHPLVRRFDLHEWAPRENPDPVFREDFENDLEDLTAVTGSVSISSQALFGSQSLAAVHDGQPAYVEMALTHPNNNLVSRFYLDVDDLQMAASDWHVIAFGIDEHYQVVTRVELAETAQGRMVRGRARDGSGQWHIGPWVPLETGPNRLTVRKTANSFAVTVHSGPTSQVSATSLSAVAALRLGAVSGLDATTTGTALFDAWETRQFTDPGWETLIWEPFSNRDLLWQVSDPGRVSVSSAAAATGRYGVQIHSAPSHNVDLLRTLDHPEDDLAGSFQFHPNGIAMTGNSHDIFVVNDQAAQGLFRIQLRQTSGGSYGIRSLTRDLGGSWVPGNWVTIENRFSEIGWHWRGGPGGVFEMSLDGTNVESRPLNAPPDKAAIIRFGAVSSLDPTTSGSVFFDQVAITKYEIPQP